MIRNAQTAKCPLANLVALAFLLTLAPTALADEGHDHGTVHHKIETNSPEAQNFFDLGLSQAFGFNHEEAARSFRRAIREDAECAMCHWGLALVLGPNINFPMDQANQDEARSAADRALELTKGAASPIQKRERSYAEALNQRYARTFVEDRSELDQAYARAMRRVAHRYPDDLDAATLFAEALMDTTPWDYWTEDNQPRKVTEEFLDVLQSVMRKQPDHPGAAHYLIHAVEKARPDVGERAADQLASAPQATGHLRHMASHIYIRLGRYHDASRVNQEAIEKDESMLAGEHAKGTYTTILAPHNRHFLVAAASLEGRKKLALSSALALRERIDQQLMREQGMETLQHFWITPLYTKARFGMWSEILAEPLPAEDLLYPRAVWHYARGLANLRTGNLEAAQEHASALRAASQDERLEAITVFDLNTTKTLMQIASGVLDGELAAASSDFRQAREHLNRALGIEQNLTYDEPPPFYFPVRQALGAVELLAGDAAAAVNTYRADLSVFPRNGWSLFGLAEALEALGKSEEAVSVRRELKTAFQHADIELRASRF